VPLRVATHQTCSEIRAKDESRRVADSEILHTGHQLVLASPAYDANKGQHQICDWFFAECDSLFGSSVVFR